MPGAIYFPTGRPAPASKESPPNHEISGASFGVVYANNLAREALIADPPIPFPRGSILVRERLPSANAKAPDVLTVMIKRQAGFNRKANGWEFLMIDGAGAKVIEQQKKGSCFGCHKSQAASDFVYPSALLEH